MQRLFSMFPRGAPGIALVVLRFAVAATLWTGEPVAFLPREPMNPALVLVAIQICLGILTPAAAVGCAVLHAASLAGSDLEPTLPALIAIANALALAMLGPGAYSIDSRIFGRRVFVVSSGRERS